LNVNVAYLILNIFHSAEMQISHWEGIHLVVKYQRSVKILF